MGVESELACLCLRSGGGFRGGTVGKRLAKFLLNVQVTIVAAC